MRPLAWLLIRWPWTISLAGLEHDLRAELDQRATCAAHGLAAPHQFRPPPDWLLVLAALALFLAYALLRPF